MDAKQYDTLQQSLSPKPSIIKNCLKAFLVGGIICTIGQLITFFYMAYFNFTERTAGNPTVATMIFLAMLFTGFGLYKKLAQFAGAGSAVPVTGFGNAVISSAIEHKSEGYVLGVGGNIFKLAGSVIVFGVVSAFVVALVKLLLVTVGVTNW
ncbi:stage V sporulation protein AC [Rummeliibacillus sp. G93]|uniref:Stage V sporulation protein AC n=1 Tax=Rummeliibacillus stabekisii TaxID=241244 RepID=A0A143H9U6_9BACL|nr:MULTISPECIES: stage V sporulation protein AC [Rummeliibacillus]AMW98219.1 stage V sporulation protein AC [Rummeliibacillus stabekisii]MBB5170097.1 stage V sporulation protein AC [Rummeliibacillus stabekisii]UQW98107.1 stage V sporulation protein AC [Rummeliibacillus sp. G93]GEL04356.1 stage V sporulation protein AC [Rummeliibacillus stabekisii]